MSNSTGYTLYKYITLEQLLWPENTQTLKNETAILFSCSCPLHLPLPGKQLVFNKCLLDQSH